ncbi:alpha/beta hydrolase [Endozoicomonas montiporae]|nr:alpha/beta hydrolase [Endozoicomonas montiporae]
MDQTINLPADDGHIIPVFQWSCDQPKAVIHISHGLSEHASRYQNLALQLNNAGFDVFAHNHRGHGPAATQPGIFAHKRGWDKVVEDLDIVVQHIKEQHPGKPLFLLGHSMGSYILQSYLIDGAPRSLAGAVLSGSNFAPQPLLKLGRGVARFESFRQGKTGQSPIIHALVFGQYNKAFKPNRTEFDWLSRDPATVDAYINDPLCGQRASNRLWYDLFGGLQSISSVSALQHINSSLPVRVVGGTHDPVSAPSSPPEKNGQHKLAKALQKAGIKDVTLTLYPEGRHEMLNEINREQVISDLIEWLEAKI